MLLFLQWGSGGVFAITICQTSPIDSLLPTPESFGELEISILLKLKELHLYSYCI